MRFPSPRSQVCWLNTSDQMRSAGREGRRWKRMRAAGHSSVSIHLGCRQVLPLPPPSLSDSSQLPGSQTTLFQQDRDPPRPHTLWHGKASNLLQRLPWKAKQALRCDTSSCEQGQAGVQQRDGILQRICYASKSKSRWQHRALNACLGLCSYSHVMAPEFKL